MTKKIDIIKLLKCTIIIILLTIIQHLIFKKLNYNINFETKIFGLTSYIIGIIVGSIKIR